MKLFYNLLKVGFGLIFIWPVIIYCQIPFDCDGRIFRVVEGDGGTYFQEIIMVQANNKADFQNLAHFKDFRVNGICYRAEDNFIYGVLLGTEYGLCRIDASYNIERLADLPLPNNLLFVAGDVSPDNKYLVLLGFNENEPTNLMAMVDLVHPDHPTHIMPLQLNDGGDAISCADIAFHPSTQILYGFNHKDHRLITIDIENGLIDNLNFQPTPELLGNVPTLFFDARGDLYGIGSEKASLSNRALFKFNLENGQVQKKVEYNYEGNQDGCSCPFKVHLWKEIVQKKVFPCTEVEFRLKIVNRSPFELTQIHLRDTLPLGMTIKSIQQNPFGGKLISGIGSRILSIEGMLLDIGEGEIIFTVAVDRHINPRVYETRAYLENVDLAGNGESATVLSDDPSTPIFLDATRFEARKLEVNFQADVFMLCPGGSVILDPNIFGAKNYNWNTGANTPTIEVTKPGNYSLSINTGCEQASAEIEVLAAVINLDLGEDIEVEAGEKVNIVPKLVTTNKIEYFFWSENLDRQILDCNTCNQVSARPMENTTLYLEVKDEYGCKVSDDINIMIKPFDFYAPNAFSPNEDGLNDIFYLQAEMNYDMEQFSVYDRWGNQLFTSNNGKVNDPHYGWNGKSGGIYLKTGVYVWKARLKQKNGDQVALSGDVMLMR